jgi:cytochrome bd-type quinol oxidase subunit 2
MDQFTQVANQFVVLCQGIGVALLAAMIALIALMLVTSFGSEHKQAIVKAAALCLLLGFALLMAAPTISTVIQKMFPAIQP